MTDKDEQPGSPAPDDAPDDDAVPDVREQMRLALERKQNRGGSGQSHADGSSKASGAKANAKVTREFRRKSGG